MSANVTTLLNWVAVNHSVQENVPLAPFTTLGIGGPARFFIEASSEQIVLESIEFARTRKLPIMILGGGSNLLVSDEGFAGVTLRVRIGGIRESDRGDARLLRAGAGVDWDDFVRIAVERNLFGVECLSGIPGWVGGTPIQNVGAYGQEVSEVVTSVRVFDRQGDVVVEMPAAGCGFGYRTSVFNTVDRGRYIVLEVEYCLQRSGRPRIDYPDLQRWFADGSHPGLADVRNAVRKIRAAKAMLRVEGDPDARSAGSFFRNPILSQEDFAMLVDTVRATVPGPLDREIPRYGAGEGLIKVPAAWLIEASGYRKGASDGPVGLSEKHALAVINKGGARARDVLRFAGAIQARVQEQFGIRLLPEPVFAGFSDDVIFSFGAVRA